MTTLLYQRVAGETKTFFNFIVLNKNSIQTIVKSKTLDHLAMPMKNAGENKFKESILTLKNLLEGGVLSIFTFFHE
jgi:hypothetical protein